MIMGLIFKSGGGRLLEYGRLQGIRINTVILIFCIVCILESSFYVF